MGRRVVYEGKYKRLIVENGWEYIERNNCSGVVMILPVTDDGKTLFVEQYRVPVGRRTVEFPAGLVNDLALRGRQERESMESAASRELAEETGYSAETVTYLMSTTGAPASVADLVAIFKAEGLKKTGPGGGDGSESITVHEVALDRADLWLAAKAAEGLLIDAKVYAGLYLLQKKA